MKCYITSYNFYRVRNNEGFFFFFFFLEDNNQVVSMPCFDIF